MVFNLLGIPGTPDLADTYYSMNDEFEKEDDSDDDDGTLVSGAAGQDGDYKQLIGCLKNALVGDGEDTSM